MHSKSSFVAPNRILYPVRVGEYVNVYVPKPWTMEEDTRVYRKGETFDTWVTNDHAFMRTEDGWHIFGITGPKPPDLVDDYHCGDHIHAAEEQLFHAFAPGCFKDVVREAAFEDHPKVLYPSKRPTGLRANAPHIIKWKGVYRIIVGPHHIRYADSTDLFSIPELKLMFEGNNSTTRDPNVFIDDDGTIYLLYANENKVCYRTSQDMAMWSDEKVLQVNPWKNGTCESPFMAKRDGFYYLFWCIWDTTHGCYDHRTFVFGHASLAGLRDASPLTMLDAHAAEIITDEDGDWYISSAFYPYNGVNVAPLGWM